MSPKAKHELAREHLDLARSDADEEDERGALSALFYAAEAAVVAIAEAHGIDTKRDHRLKADAASHLHERKILDEDFGPLLRSLNQQRKDVWYEGEPADFGDEDFESIIEAVERLVTAAEEASS